MAERQDILCACGCQGVCRPGRTWVTGHNSRLQSLNFEERFWERVQKTDTCWIWTGVKSEHGYGTTGVAGKTTLVHRIAYAMAYGPIPPGLQCLHHCDNPPCLRPEHLFLGTPADNMQDMVRKGRHWVHTRPELLRRGDRNVSRLYPDTRPRGEQVKLAKVTEAQVKAMRYLWRTGDWKQHAIGLVFGISHRTVSLIVRYKTWRHVPDD